MEFRTFTSILSLLTSQCKGVCGWYVCVHVVQYEVGECAWCMCEHVAHMRMECV